MSDERQAENRIDEAGLSPSSAASMDGTPPPPPPQPARPSEWPKKLRTLTAAELDRLTIDENGRFYWDGRLVDYGVASLDADGDHFDGSLAIIERTSHDLGLRKSPTTIEGAIAEHVQSTHATSPLDPPAPAALEAGPHRGRLRLSGAQTLAVAIAILALVIVALSVASYSYLAMRDWSCRTGASKSGCPAPEMRSRRRCLALIPPSSAARRGSGTSGVDVMRPV